MLYFLEIMSHCDLHDLGFRQNGRNPDKSDVGLGSCVEVGRTYQKCQRGNDLDKLATLNQACPTTEQE